MENPFLPRNYWNAPRPRFSTNPVRHHYHPPKVVLIPVRFVGSDTTRSEAATKIQKLFRGFAVRKNVKKIAKIRSQVEEIQRQISQSETLDLIEGDAKERLRLSETLMSLLFQLDSVRGVDPAVRDCRKAVIRKAIALQEAIDAMLVEKQETVADSVDQTLDIEAPAETAAAAQNPDDESPEADEQTSEIRDPVAIDAIVDKEETEIVADSVNQTLEIESAAERTLESQNPLEFPEADEQSSQVQDPAGSTDNCRNPPSIDDVLETKLQVDVENQTIAGSVPVDDHPALGMGIESRDEEECVEMLEEGGIEGKSVEKSDFLGAVEEEDVVKRVMGENEKLRGLVSELCERNDEQSRLIESLSRRVDQLERAVVVRCQRIRKKKKRNAGKMERELERMF